MEATVKLHWARRSRTATAARHIAAVRTERGPQARGDVLLRSAYQSLREGDSGSAAAALESFLRVVPAVQPEHRALIEGARSVLTASRHWLFTAIGPLLKFATFVVATWLKLTHKHPLNYFATL